MTTTLRPRRDEVRTALVAAAADLFTRQGYGATTLSEIAATAGFTKGAIYSNFGGKPELFAAAVSDRFVERATGAVAAAVRIEQEATGVLNLAEQLTEVVVSDTWPALMAEFRALAATDAAVAAAYAEVRREQQRNLATRLREHAVALRVPPDLDLDAVAVLLLTVIQGLAAEHAASPAAMPADLVRASLNELLRGLLR